MYDQDANSQVYFPRIQTYFYEHIYTCYQQLRRRENELLVACTHKCQAILYNQYRINSQLLFNCKYN